MHIPRQLQTGYAPDSPELIGLIRAGVLGGDVVNPLTIFARNGSAIFARNGSAIKARDGSTTLARNTA